MVYPTTPRERVKYWFWMFYTPFHPPLREVFYKIGIGELLARRVVPEMVETGRQDFLIGTIRPEYSVQEITTYLVSQGFGNHFIAWRDADEVVSLRRTVDFKNQYHIRIFTDGEIRGHYEYTPEYRTFLHLVRIGFEDRLAEFNELLRDWIIPATEPTA